jgi:precorrin-6B methylase 2
VTCTAAVVDKAVAIDASGEAVEMDAENCRAVHFDDPGTARLTA